MRFPLSNAAALVAGRAFVAAHAAQQLHARVERLRAMGLPESYITAALERARTTDTSPDRALDDAHTRWLVDQS